MAWYRRSIGSNPNYSLTHFFLGGCLARLGQLAEARASVQAGLALDRASPLGASKPAGRANTPDTWPGTRAISKACAKRVCRKVEMRAGMSELRCGEGVSLIGVMGARLTGRGERAGRSLSLSQAF